MFCSKCKNEIISPVKAGKVNGKLYYRSVCQECYQKTKLKRRRKLRNLMDEFKRTLKCSDCGNSDHRVLDFHHGDGENKDITIADSIRSGWGWERLKKELLKCTPLCANYHRIRHYDEQIGKYVSG